MNLPLTNIRVIDLGQFVAGPVATTLMAEFGAEVIKVERPRLGDVLRTSFPVVKGVGTLNLMTNRNKASVTLDLRTAQGQAVLRDLVGHCDVLVENFRPGTLEKWNLSPEILLEVNPRLVVVRASAFGQTGPLAHGGGLDRIGLAMGGVSNLGGDSDGPPLRPGVLMADCSTAMWGFFGALAALHHRRVTGAGQVVDVNLYESVLRMLGDAAPHYDATGTDRQRNGAVWYTNPLSVTAQASDGDVTVTPPFGRSPIDDAPVRLEKEEARCREWLTEWIGARTVGKAVEEARAKGWAATKVNSVEDILSDEHVAARGDVISVTHPVLGAFRMQASLPHLARGAGNVRESWPEIGEDNKTVYCDLLGYTMDRLRELEEQGVV